MNIQSKKIRKSSFFQKSLFSHLKKWDFYKSFILACVWSAKKYFKTHHGQIRWTPETPLLSNTPLIKFYHCAIKNSTTVTYNNKNKDKLFNEDT